MNHRLPLAAVLKACVVLLLGAITFVLFQSFFQYLWQTWQIDPFYRHGVWVAAVSVAFYLWQIYEVRKDPFCRLETFPKASFLLGLLFLLSFGFGVYTHIAFLGGLAFVFWMIVVNQVLFSSARHTIHFPALYVLTAVPIPFLGEISGLLQIEIARLSTWFLNLFGFEILRSGIIIGTQSVQFQIAPNCTGISSWLVLTSLVLFFLYFMKGRLSKKILLFGLILPVAFLSNWIRVLSLILVGIYFGETVAMQFWHMWGDILFYVLACCLTFLCMLVLFRKHGYRN